MTVAGGFVGCGVLVGGTVGGFPPGWEVLVGTLGVLVAAGRGWVTVGVGERTTPGVAVSTGLLVGLLSPGSVFLGVGAPGKVPSSDDVGVGEGKFGVTSAIPAGLPVSGGWFMPSKSWRISNPIAGTETGISSTP